MKKFNILLFITVIILLLLSDGLFFTSPATVVKISSSLPQISILKRIPYR